MSHSFQRNRGSSTSPWYTVGRKTNDKNLEQRINIKFYVNIGKSASEMLALLTVAYGEYTMKKSSVFEWHRRFKEGREDVQDDPRSGQPKTQRTDANVKRVWNLVRSDRRWGVTVIGEELNMNRETVWQCIGRFGNEKNFCKNGASHLNTLPETMSASHFIRSFTQCRDVW